jgi:hypothetical protein
MVRRVLPVVLSLMLVMAACGGTSDSEPTDETVPAGQSDMPADLVLFAQFTCNQLMGVAAAGAEPVITKGLTRAASSGYTGAEFRDALRSNCPDIIGPLESDAEISSLFES